MNKLIQQALFSLFLLSAFPLLAQKNTLSGRVIDAKLGDALIGAAVRLDDGAGGATTDYDGKFSIQNVAPGIHKITVQYVGYTTKVIEDIRVGDDTPAGLDIALEEAAAQSLSEVVVVAKANRESQSALTILQKNSPTIGDGISAESIRQTPDRSAGEVIRRVSGASMQDNKFAIIRGLNDRYNIALLNGALLSSTEPDRKAFSFDLFPAAMLDNLVVVKTAGPDLPGEFAGGAILVSTKDAPEKAFVQASLSAGYNDQSTFRPHLSGAGGGMDLLGHDDGTRALPDGFPASADFKKLSKDEKYAASRLFANDWSIREQSNTRPNTGLQLSGGFLKHFNERVQFGAIMGLSYQNSNRLQNGMRADYDASGQLFDFNDQQFKNNVLWGALYNSSLKIGSRHSIGLQATYSTNTDNIISDRTGNDFEQQRIVRSTAIEYTENHLLSSRLSGEHQLSEKGMLLKWGGGYNRSERNVPSLRRMFYFKNFEDTSDVTVPFQAYVPFGSADPYRSGRFYSNLSEDTYNGNADLSIPFQLSGEKQLLKIGTLYQQRDRGFQARVMGYVIGNYVQFDYNLLRLPQDELFTADHIGEKGFIMDDITNPSDGYEGRARLAAGYVMFDNRFLGRFRATWGARVERFRQQVQSGQYGGAPLSIDTTVTSLLPSFNLTYHLTEKQQLRLSGSKTLSRAEFRELAPFSFFDFYLNANVVGNPNLTQGSIYNADLRYELYPGQNQLLSVSLFYKHFDNPIEFTFAAAGAGTRTFSYNNVASANNYGAELEFRKNLDFIGAEQATIFSNASLIRSNIDLSKGVSYYDSTRALQGQSPYLLNAGMSYRFEKIHLTAALIYNVIGDRIAQVGTVGYGDIYERRRHLLDLSLHQRIGKFAELKITWSDILSRDFFYYQDNNASHRFEADKDNVMQRLNLGSTIGISLGCKF